MAQTDDESDAVLRDRVHGETAKIPWKELQLWFANGSAISVSQQLDLIEVAAQFSLDNAGTIDSWMSAGHIRCPDFRRCRLACGGV
jgi:hypothetical protein